MSETVPHDRHELERLLEVVEGSSSVLEIGSRYGYTLRKMARVMKPGSRIVSVDLPRGPWGANSEKYLQGNMEGLRCNGFDTHLFLGNSRDPEIVEKVKALGPFDVVFIDGDHRYDGVKADWLNYGPLGKTVIFHDIVLCKQNKGRGIEVYKLWREIEGKKEEFVAKGSTMGIGIWRRD